MQISASAGRVSVDASAPVAGNASHGLDRSADDIHHHSKLLHGCENAPQTNNGFTMALSWASATGQVVIGVDHRILAVHKEQQLPSNAQHFKQQ